MVSIGPKHDCASTSKVTGKEASAAWIANRVKPMLIKEPGLGAREMQYRLEDQFTVTLSYNKVWEGRKLALKELHGTWEDSFKLLWNWKAAVEATCPGSLIEIDCKKVKGQMHFSKMFVALRPCVNGFLMGCRPYLGVDSTHLTGKYLGQLASATAIDGHNWMYPVAYTITKSGYMKGEVSGASRDGVAWRYGVNLVTKACSCGQWDVTGKPCTHAIAFITSQRNLRIEDYVGECYSVQRFKDAYQFEVYPMGDRLQWPKLDPGFEMRPPKLEGRPAGRPRKKRIKSAGEPGKRGPYQCKRCFQYGHIEKGCKNPVVEPHEDLPDNHLQRKTKKGTKKR